MRPQEGGHRGDTPFSVQHVTGYMMLTCITGDVNLDHLANLSGGIYKYS